MAQAADEDDRSARVLAFPRAAPASAAPRRDAPEAAMVAALRRAARDLQVSPPLDLDRLAAQGGAADAPDLWARALIETAARGARLTFHRQAEPMVSATECWLASLIVAAGAGDEPSAAFLTRRFIARADRRLALCFAQRLAQALAARRAA